MKISELIPKTKVLSGNTPIARQVLASSGLFRILIGNNRNNTLNYFPE